ncbi:hypothetical protein [Streptomyces sp. NPDC047108]|uniref:hypothetical protein n=1 Tax=Streptomyces sp. NPDC047108 TaxID=3155025 RepID=UPI003409AAB2
MLVQARTAGAAAAVAVAALLLGGCGTEGSGTDDDAPARTAAPSEEDGGSGGGEGGDGAGDEREVGPEAIAGVWRTTGLDGEYHLSVTGRKAVLAGEHPCTGTVTAGKGRAGLALGCKDGNTERTKGTAAPSQGGRTLTVEWGSGASETYTKVGGGKLPEGLPTGLGGRAR